MIFANPVRGPIQPAGWTRPRGNTDFRVTQPYGSGKGVIAAEPKLDGKPFHRGIDISDGGCGSAVLAPAPAVVQFEGVLGNGEIVVVLDHGKGWGSSYGHLARSIVRKGQRVAEREKIGDVGDTGFAAGCHLHWATKDRLPAGFTRLDFIPNPLGGTGDTRGRWVDPWPLLAQNQPEDDVYPVTRYLPGSTAIVKASARIRSAPNTTGPALRTLTSPETWTVIGFVKGETAEGSADWLERWAGTAYEYTHSQNVGAVTAPATDCAPLVATARQAGYDAAKSAASAAVAGI